MRMLIVVVVLECAYFLPLELWERSPRKILGEAKRLMLLGISTTEL